MNSGCRGVLHRVPELVFLIHIPGLDDGAPALGPELGLLGPRRLDLPYHGSLEEGFAHRIPLPLLLHVGNVVITAVLIPLPDVAVWT